MIFFNDDDDNNNGKIAIWVIIHIDTRHGGNPDYHFEGNMDCLENLDY